MSNSVLVPIGLTFDRWAHHLIELLPDLDIPLSNGEENWREWANQVIAINKLETVPVANELVFPDAEDWRKWGAYFTTLINLP